MTQVNIKFYLEKAANFRPLDLDDNYRHPEAARDGGFALTDQQVINKYRTAFKKLLAEIGRQLITGKFNLTKTSFPIACMAPTSIVQIASRVVGPMARFFDAAAVSQDPVERMKLVMTASISFLESCHTWGKPLNPILGETYQATLPNGAVLSVEQVSHHPPVTYICLDGP